MNIITSWVSFKNEAKKKVDPKALNIGIKIEAFLVGLVSVVESFDFDFDFDFFVEADWFFLLFLKKKCKKLFRNYV